MEDELILRAELRDDVSGGARRVALSIEGIGDAARHAERAADRAANSSNRLRGGLAGLAGVSSRATRGLSAVSGGLLGIVTAGGRAASTIGVGLAAAATLGGASILRLASDAGEVESKFNTVFGAARGEVQGFVDDMHSRFGIAVVDLQNMAATFGVFGQAADVPIDQLGEFSTALAGAALDLASFYNANPEEVAESLRAGLSGETEPLRKFGIFLTESIVAARGETLGFTGELTEQQKVIARNAEIMAQFREQAAFGDLPRTAGSLANMWRNLAGRASTLAAEVGKVLIPALEILMPLMESGLIRATTWLNANLPRLQENARRVGEAIASVARARTVPGGIVGLFGGHAAPGIVRDLARGIGRVQDAIRTTMDFVNTQRTPGGAFLALFGTEWAPLVSEVVGAAGDLRRGIGDVFTATGGMGESAFAGLRSWWAANQQPVIDEAAKVVEALRTAIKEKLEGWADVAEMVGSGDWRGAGERLGEMLVEGLENVGDLGAIIGGWFAKIDWVGVGVSAGKAAVPLVIGLVAGIIEAADPMTLIPQLAPHWEVILMGVLSIAFMPAKWAMRIAKILRRIPFAGKLLGWLTESISGFGSKITSFLGDIFGTLGSSFMRHLDNAGPGIMSRVRSFFSGIPETLRGLADDVGIRVLEFVDNLGAKLAGGVNRMREAAREMMGGALSGIRELLGDLRGLGGDVLRAVWNGIKALGGWFKERVGSLVTGAFSGVTSLFGGQGGEAEPRLMGGSVRAGALYLVGERGPELFVGADGTHLLGSQGPELFVPPSSGYVEPTERTAALLAPALEGGTHEEHTTYHVTINATGDPSAIWREFESRLRAHERSRAERRTRWQR